MKTIKINEKEYKIKYTIRALFIFEQIAGKPFAIDSLLDNYIFFYAILLANNPDEMMTWDDFINALDENPEIFAKIADAVNDLGKVDDMMAKSDDDGQKKTVNA